MRQSSVAWVFVAHSTRDIDKVRRVRDVVEEEGGEPILFFLKCITDDDELDGLLKREIDARNVFLLCDSRNARHSDYVQEEFRHARSGGKEPLVVIDLDDPDWEQQEDLIRALVRRATLFLSYSRRDAAAVEPIRAALIESDLAIWETSDDLNPDAPFADQIREAIDEAARFGHFLHFISSSSLSSPYVSAETERAIESTVGDRYLPILLEPPSAIGHLLPSYVQTRQWIDFSAGDVTRALPQLLQRLGVKGTEQAH